MKPNFFQKVILGIVLLGIALIAIANSLSLAFGLTMSASKVKTIDSVAVENDSNFSQTNDIETFSNEITAEQEVVAVPMIGSGGAFTAVLKQNGTVWTSGINTYGQLGDGTLIAKEEFAQVQMNESEYLTDVVHIAVRNKSRSSCKKRWNSMVMGI